MPFIIHRFGAVHALSPDGAVAVASLGFLMIFFELNRPGRILPASFGLLFVLLASASVFRLGVQPWPSSLLLAAGTVLGFNLYRKVPASLLIAATCGCAVGLRFLVRPGSSAGVHTPVAVVCGGVLGALSAVLTRIAYRARRAKALN